MAKMVLTASYLAINAVDISSYCSKIEITVNVEKKDVTTYASVGWKELLGGLKSGQLSFEAFNDFAAGALDSQLWALLGVVTTFEVRPSNAAVSATNPKWTGSVLVDKVQPISGKVGDVNGSSYAFDTSGPVPRATA